MHGLILGIGEAPHRAQPGAEPLQKRDRLEELERTRVFGEFVAQRASLVKPAVSGPISVAIRAVPPFFAES